jgi:RuvB-like protein 1 (pontin 52)
MLDMECFTYLNRALESTISPHVILATNRGSCVIRGTEYDGGIGSESQGIVSPHGIPIDLLDRCMIVRTLPYDRNEIKEVIKLRAKTEGLVIDEDALEKVTDGGLQSSLRYALQLLTPASILARVNGRSQITLQDLFECQTLFIDAKSSAIASGTARLL